MKNLILVFLLFCGLQSIAQTPKASPPAVLETQIADAKISIHYHSPAVNGRDVWGPESSLAPYNKLWRTGANNATTFATDKDILIDGKKLAKGKYALFTIPGQKEWTIIFNKKAKQWGSYSYNEKDDALRIKVIPNNNSEFSERFIIEKNEDKKIVLKWEKVSVPFTIN